MKKLILAIPFIFIACIFQEQTTKPNPNPPVDSLAVQPSSLRESRDIWESWKHWKGNSYSYSVLYASVFGSWNESKVSVRNDSVKTITRIFGDMFIHIGDDDLPSTTKTTKHINYDTLSVWEKQWYKTIDEMYQFCQDSVLSRDKSKNDIHELEFHVNGILKSCTYYPYGCQDDCIFGPRIDSVFFDR